MATDLPERDTLEESQESQRDPYDADEKGKQNPGLNFWDIHKRRSTFISLGCLAGTVALYLVTETMKLFLPP